MTIPTPQEAALKQALRDHVLAATPKGSGMTHARLAGEANVSASTLSKAITAGSNYLPPADITRNIVTACLRHAPATVTVTEVQAEAARVEDLRRAAKDTDVTIQSYPVVDVVDDRSSGDDVADLGSARQGSPADDSGVDDAPGEQRRGNRHATRRVVIPALGVLVLVLVVVVAVISTRVLFGPDTPVADRGGAGPGEILRLLRNDHQR